MLFVASLALAATTIGYPCQRLNWAWRNVWSTCSINSYIPASSSGTATGFLTSSSTALTGAPPIAPPYFTLNTGNTGPSVAGIPNGPVTYPALSQLDPNGYFAPFWPGITNSLNPTPAIHAPTDHLCFDSMATGYSMQRNRCRRMLDAYGQLIGTCSSPKMTSSFQPNSLSPDYMPTQGHAPHVTNLKNLFNYYALCQNYPGGSLPTQSNTCPGLMGWFTVVWNACMVYAPGIGVFPTAPFGTIQANPTAAPAVPAYLTPWTAAATPSAPGFRFTNPEWFCGSVSTPSSLGAAFPNTPSVWNTKGPGVFTKSKCRRALDQFGRSAARCAPNSPYNAAILPNGAPMAPYGWGNTDYLRYLAYTLIQPATPNGGVSPWCSI
jgi:hypothetical protein